MSFFLENCNDQEKTDPSYLSWELGLEKTLPKFCRDCPGLPGLVKYSKTGVQGFFATNQAWIAKFLLKLKIAKDAYLLENTLTKEFSYIRKPTG